MVDVFMGWQWITFWFSMKQQLQSNIFFISVKFKVETRSQLL